MVSIKPSSSFLVKKKKIRCIGSKLQLLYQVHNFKVLPSLTNLHDGPEGQVPLEIWDVIASILQKGMRAQTSHPASGHRSFCVPFRLSKMPPVSDDRTAGLCFLNLIIRSRLWGGSGGGRVGVCIFSQGDWWQPGWGTYMSLCGSMLYLGCWGEGMGSGFQLRH